MRRIVIFGKGGIGKSTIAAGLSATYARAGKKVLHVGCDPKQDSTLSLLDGEVVEPFMSKLVNARGRGRRHRWSADELVQRGPLGVDCVEAGGPEAGVGCAGRGITLMLEAFQQTKILTSRDYDVCLFDVLGDVVCGGFAAPLRKGFGEAVVIVISEELMSLYAANNIARAVCTYAPNGIWLAGLVANVRDPDARRQPLEQFAALLSTNILEFIPRDSNVREAEYRGGRSVVEQFPDAPFTQHVGRLAETLSTLSSEDATLPTPMKSHDFCREWRRRLEDGAAGVEPAVEPAVEPHNA
jgi:nitrogenase iron protein NifH